MAVINMHGFWLVLFLFTPDVAHAYIGPSLGLGALAVIMGLVVALLTGLAALAWYPAKRMLKTRKTSKRAPYRTTLISTTPRRRVVAYLFLGVIATTSLIIIAAATVKPNECYAFRNRLLHTVGLLNAVIPAGHIAQESPVLLHHKAETPIRDGKEERPGAGALQKVQGNGKGVAPRAQAPISHSFYKDKYLLITSMFDGTNAMRLIDERGVTVNEWVFDPLALFPHRRLTHKGVDLHGSVILPDGSVIANFEYLGTARLDRCGKALWTFPEQRAEHLKVTHNTHHVVSITPRGTIWVAGRKLTETKRKTFAPPIMEELLIELDKNGNILQAHSLLDIMFDSHVHALLLGPAYQEADVPDMLHINDIEELPPDKASAFPQFQAGDLLISLHSPSTLLVVDGKSFQVKWFYKGTFLHQHDPDWQADGTITLFDNQEDDSGGVVYGGSRILQIDPQTYEEAVLYSDGTAFYSAIRGKHEVLDDGNILIAEFSRGRVFMVDPEGDILFEYVNPVACKHPDGMPRYYEITKAEFIPNSYFTQSPECNAE